MATITRQAFLRGLMATALSATLPFQGFAQGTGGTQTGGQNAASGTEAETWPRSFETGDEATMTLYQPQVTEWKDFKSMTALIAAEYKPKGSDDPAYGVIEVNANTSADRESDEVVLTDISVTNVNFSTLSRNELSDAALKVGALLPTAPLTVSLTRVTASLSDYQRLQDTKDLSTDSPPIYVSEKPAILLQTNGKPTTAPVKGTDGVEFVINTNWDLLVTGDPQTYYLRDDKSWLSATDIKGPWTAADSLPATLSKLPKDDNWKEANEAIPPQPFKEGDTPEVVYSDKPAELIVIDGAPKLEAVPGTQLQWVSNANTDLFFDDANKTWYFLTSGRWFEASDLQGPWAFASADLPEDFRLIPDGQPYSVVRASVPGTSESEEARLRASIPTTARVDRKAVSVEVTYYGDPKFERIAGTDLEYAVNTEFTVILVNGKYFVLYNGVWFVGDTPTGPFAVADSVPADIYSIPPSSPVYNATYVRIYDTTPDYVVVGYTAGYLWGFLAWGTFVYGTGWYYPPYWYYRPGYPPIYRPWRVTYGSGTYYLPGRGTFNYHWGRAYGPYGGIAAGGIYNANTGAYVRGGAAWGPYNSGAFISVRGPGGNTYRAAIIDGNVYKSWNGKGVTRTNTWLRDNRTGDAGQWRSGGKNLSDQARQKNLFANHDGNVYRNQDGKWQKHENNNWRNLGDEGEKKIERRSSGGSRLTQNPSVRENLDRDFRGRERGGQRIQQRRDSFGGGGGRSFQRPTTRRFERRR